MRRGLRDPKALAISTRTLKMHSSDVGIPPFARPHTATYFDLRNGSRSGAGADAEDALADAAVEGFEAVVLEDNALEDVALEVVVLMNSHDGRAAPVFERSELRVRSSSLSDITAIEVTCLGRGATALGL